MFPVGLNRASVANPAYAVCGPRERPTTQSIGAADGVASNSAVNVPDCAENAVFCQAPPEVAVTHPVPCNSSDRTMLLPLAVLTLIFPIAIVTPISRKHINEKWFLVDLFILYPPC